MRAADRTGHGAATAALRRACSAASESRLLENLPLILFAIAVAGSIVLLLDYGAGLNFFADEWSFLLYRRGFTAAAFFMPHNEHIAVIPVAVYKLLLAVFGMTSTAPFRTVSTSLLAGTAALLFVFLRRRVGDWLALFACSLVLFLGPAWADLLWPFEISLVGSLAAGIAMLIALDRGDRTGDRWACALLTASVLCSSLGLSFIVAAAVDVGQRRADWRRRAFVPAIPLALYAIWYAAYGHDAATNITLHNVVTSPIYLVNGVAAALQSLLGLVAPLGTRGVRWGWVALALVALATVIRLRRGPRPGRKFWTVVAAAASFWLLAGSNYIPGREATQSRYQYIGAAFVLLVGGELMRGARPRRAAVWIGVAGVIALAMWSNLDGLDRARVYLRDQTALSRADLGAIEIARRTVDPLFSPTPDIAGPTILPVLAGPYLSAANALGSPADSPSQLAVAPAIDRAWADDVLGHALPVTLTPNDSGTARLAGRPPSVRGGGTSGASARGPCLHLPANAAGKGTEVRPAGPDTVIRPADGSPAIVELRRFATGSFPLTPGGVGGGTTSVLTIPRDRTDRPWDIRILAKQAVALCNAVPPPVSGGTG